MLIERRIRTTRPLPLVALIDILFQLLIFFMLATSFVRQQSIELALPSAQAPKIVAPPVKPWRLEVESGGLLKLNHTSMDSTALSRTLRDQFAQSPETGIVVLSGQGVNLQELVSVMDMIYLSGGKNVAVANQKLLAAPIPMMPTTVPNPLAIAPIKAAPKPAAPKPAMQVPSGSWGVGRGGALGSIRGDLPAAKMKQPGE